MLLSFEHFDSADINPFEVVRAGYSQAIGGTAMQYESSIAELLLKNPAVAIMHAEEPPDEEISPTYMLAANYHGGGSEGWHKIIVQSPSDPKKSQWELWTPPGAQNKTFYRRSLWTGEPYPHETVPTNPDKISNYILHVGPTDEAMHSFRELGFIFRDEVLLPASEKYQRLERFADAAPYTWNPQM